MENVGAEHLYIVGHFYFLPYTAVGIRIVISRRNDHRTSDAGKLARHQLGGLARYVSALEQIPRHKDNIDVPVRAYVIIDVNALRSSARRNSARSGESPENGESR